MTPTERILAWGAIGVGALVALRIAFKAGERKQASQLVSIGTDTGPLANPVSMLSVPLSVAPQEVSVKRGTTIAIYPPDVHSSILSYSTGGSTQAPPSPAGPIQVTANGSGTITVSWQDAQGAGHSTPVTINAT